MFFWYRNSFLASVFSIIGCGLVILGISLCKSEGISSGILSIVIGVALAVLGYWISSNKN